MLKTSPLSPEKANQTEGGLKWQPKSGIANITFSYYNIKVQNQLIRDPQNPSFSIQGGSVRSSGLEVDVALSPIEGLDLIAGYAYNDTKVLKHRNPKWEGNKFNNAPQHLVNFFASYTFSGALKGLDMGFGGNYRSEAFAWHDNVFILDAYTILNANIGYSVGDVRFGLRAENLTSTQYFNFNGQAQAPLRVLGSVSMRF